MTLIARGISMLRDHKGDLRSPEMKTLVDNTIPVLEQHKDLAFLRSSNGCRQRRRGRENTGSLCESRREASAGKPAA